MTVGTGVPVVTIRIVGDCSDSRDRSAGSDNNDSSDMK